ncbi:MAG TPA: hypothetical protein VKY51_01460 [Fredinandcohnia sp.]|nr:hypothetical protein [Fredinandcohnia sp.]
MEVRHVYRWDLDKTYLRTDFDTLRGLLRAAREKASAKVNVAGSRALVRALQERPGARVAIISGSPRQMRRKLEEKFRLDGVEIDELVLKPNVENIVRGRFRAIRDQVGYKLPALLEGRSRVPSTASETLFGDDAEADAFVYSLYADIVEHRISAAQLSPILELCGVYDDDAERALRFASNLPMGPPIERIFIHLDGYSPPARFEAYGRRVVPIYNYFQAAILLLLDGHIGPGAIVRLAVELTQGYGYSLVSLANSFQDLVRRGLARAEDLGAIRLAFEAHAALIEKLRPASEVVQAFVDRLKMVSGMKPARVRDEAPIDYLAILGREGPPNTWRRRRRPKPRRRDLPF